MTIFSIDKEHKTFIRLVNNCKLKNGKSLASNKCRYQLAVLTEENNNQDLNQEKLRVLIMGVAVGFKYPTQSNLITEKLKLDSQSGLKIFEIASIFFNSPNFIPSPLLFFYKKNTQEDISKSINAVLGCTFLNTISSFQQKVLETEKIITEITISTKEKQKKCYQVDLEILAMRTYNALIKQFGQKIGIIGLKLDNFFMLWEGGYTLQNTCAIAKDKRFLPSGLEVNFRSQENINPDHPPIQKNREKRMELENAIILTLQDFRKTIQYLKNTIELLTNLENKRTLEKKINNFEKKLVALSTYEKIVTANKQLQILKCTVINYVNTQTIKNKLSLFFFKEQSFIKEIIAYKESLSRRGKLGKNKASSFNKILEKINALEHIARSPLFIEKKLVAKQIQSLEDEIQQQKTTLEKYRGFTFFRNLMRCIGRGQVTSLKHITKLEITIKDCKKSLHILPGSENAALPLKISIERGRI